MQSELILLVKNPIALQSLGRRPGDLVPFEILLSNWTFMGQPAWYGKDAVLSWAATLVGGPSLGNGSSTHFMDDFNGQILPRRHGRLQRSRQMHGVGSASNGRR